MTLKTAAKCKFVGISLDAWVRSTLKPSPGGQKILLKLLPFSIECFYSVSARSTEQCQFIPAEELAQSVLT